MGVKLMSYQIEPIGYVHATRAEAVDDFWGGSQSVIRLVEDYGPEALQGLEEFSHVEILFLLDRVASSEIVSARHPRNNVEWPKVGIFAERGSRRPNRLGSTICSVVGVSGRELRVRELDAIDETPVIDIKPVISEFLPRGDVRQPVWSRELMDNYWKECDA